MNLSYRDSLQLEREKLDQMIEDALKLDITIAEDAKIQAQARLVERLIENTKEKE